MAKYRLLKRVSFVYISSVQHTDKKEIFDTDKKEFEGIAPELEAAYKAGFLEKIVDKDKAIEWKDEQKQLQKKTEADAKSKAEADAKAKAEVKK